MLVRPRTRAARRRTLGARACGTPIADAACHASGETGRPVRRAIKIAIPLQVRRRIRVRLVVPARPAAFAQEGRPGGNPVEEIAAEEEEQRKEEARLRAEAEQAALEQLKEENPEAYEKPASDDAEGEDADESGSNDGSEEE